MMQDSATISTDDRALIAKFRAQLDESDGVLVHDLGDPETAAFVKLMHNLCGNTEADFPGLHGMLAAGGVIEKATAEPVATAAFDAPTDDSWNTAFGIPEVGPLANALAAAKGYGTVVGGFQVCNLSALVLAPNSSFLASGSAAGYAPLNTLGVETAVGGALQYVPGSTAMMTYSVVKDGTSFSGTVRGTPTGVANDPAVIEPKRENGNTNPYNPNAICIGLGRPQDLTQCDYIFNEPTQDHPIGRLPLVGNVTFNYPIKTLNPGTNFRVAIMVIRTDNGGQTELDPTDMTTVYQNFQIVQDGIGKTLSWNLPMQANRNPPDPPQTYTPVVFPNVPWATEMTSYLTVNITVTLDDGTPNGKIEVVTIQSVPGGIDTNPIDGVAYIMPVEFVWHCLLKGTLVTLATGETKPIEQIVAGDEVLGLDGQSATVTVTHNAPHAQSIFQLETECGKTLGASAEHLVLTPDGPVPAGALQVGDTVETSDGPSVLRLVDEVPGDGQVLWNLSLGQAPSFGEGTAVTEGFHANGILVGDARANRAERFRQIQDPDFAKSKVPASFHADVDSAFRQQRARMLI